MVKKLGKSFLCWILEGQVRRLRRNNEITVIAVGGSVGKTSAKLAIAKMLSSRSKVMFQDGNYNDRLTVPLVFFGHSEPGIFDIPAWLRLIRQTSRQSREAYPYEFVVVELGTDYPGQMKDFAYLKPDIFVLTAIAAEHMEYFKTLDAVAIEELVPLQYSRLNVINADDVAKKYLPEIAFHAYGTKESVEYRLVNRNPDNDLELKLATDTVGLQSPLLGTQGAKIVLGAATVAHLLGWSVSEIMEGVKAITPVSGRLQKLKGIKNSIILDDTYNASPISVKAGLDVLYEMKATQRIAILGTMNELGDQTKADHEAVGAYCDPAKLDLVVTIGLAAKEYLAPSAAEAGCNVKCVLSPFEAAEYVRPQIRDGAVIFAKGSQNGVFAEEAIKPLLQNQNDAKKLVRQGPYWMNRKRKQWPLIKFD
jgi:UDP-N-acetylmuramoyl-tripeptide--D-alanyl-D-alanine ligase